MLKEYLLGGDLVHIQWNVSIPGIQVCQFDLPAAPKTNMATLSDEATTACMEVLFCQGGRLLAELSENGLLTVEEKESVLISNVSKLHSVQISGSLKGILVSVDPKTARDHFQAMCSTMGLELDPQLIQQKIETKEGCVVLSDGLWNQAMFEHLEHLPENVRGQYCILKTVELLYLLCMENIHIKEGVDTCTGGYTARSITNACAYMESHLSEKMTISDLSYRFSISPTSLKSGFRRMYGTTLHRWLMEQRMKRARELLQSTDMTIQRIAQMVGYDGVSQFNVTFKRYYGVTPGQFAKMSETVKTCPFH